MDCPFNLNDDELWECPTCGYVYPKKRPKPPRKRCPNRPKETRKLLGDHIHAALSAIGITEERVSAWLGRPCGCGKRRKKLNRLDAWVRDTASLAASEAKLALLRLIGHNEGCEEKEPPTR
jgi:hypothetical protein